MIATGHLIVIHDEEHDHYQLCRVIEPLTKRLYMVQSLCPHCGSQHHEQVTRRFVLDIKMLAEQHSEWGPRGEIFESWEQFQEAFGPSDGDHDDETEAGPEPAPTPAVH